MTADVEAYIKKETKLDPDGNEYTICKLEAWYTVENKKMPVNLEGYNTPEELREYAKSQKWPIVHDDYKK